MVLFYKCTVCPHMEENIFEKMTTLAEHRETRDHRGHRAYEKNVVGSRNKYCGRCKMPILTSDHFDVHFGHVATRETVMCNLCGMRIFRYDIDEHSRKAHPNQYFRCLIGSCSRDFLYANMLHKHQREEHGVYNLNAKNCHYPENLVKIKCMLCEFFVLCPDRELVLEHLMRKHRKSERDFLEYMCRVCNWRGETVPDVEDHAKSHLKEVTEFSYSNWRSKYRRAASYERSESPKERSHVNYKRHPAEELREQWLSSVDRRGFSNDRSWRRGFEQRLVDDRREESILQRVDRRHYLEYKEYWGSRRESSEETPRYWKTRRRSSEDRNNSYENVRELKYPKRFLDDDSRSSSPVNGKREELNKFRSDQKKVSSNSSVYLIN